MNINGNLVFNSDGSGEIQNMYIERLASNPTHDPAQKGRVIFNTTNSLFYYNDGSAWVSFATGGSATAIQSEVDALETALGTAINSNGTFNGTAFTGYGVIASATSITEALTLLSDAQTTNDALSELVDVAITAPANGQFLKYNTTTSKWENAALVLADVSDVTASAAEVNILDGATLTTTELNFVTGVTSAIQDQLDDKQPLDATLTALAAFNTNGILVQTAADTFAGRSITAPAEGITVTNGDGVAGNIAIDLANDLAAVEGLATNGFAVRTGDGTWTTRSIGGAAGRISITNGDGVASNADIDLASVVDSGTGVFKKVTVDGYGRVTGTTDVVTADITPLVDSTYVNVAGDTMTGNLDFGGTAKVTGLAAPTNSGDAATKNYVDAVAGGLSWQPPVDSTGPSNPLTATTGDRFLNTTDFKIYTAIGTNAWDGAVPADGWAVFDRSTETGYVYPGTGAWVQFTGTGQITAGIVLSKTGNTLDVNIGAGLMDDTDSLTLKIASGSAISKTEGAGLNEVALLLDGGSASGLAQSVSGLKIGAAGVTNAMLVNSSISLNGDTGTGSVDLGATLAFDGDSVTGIATSVAGNTVTISASDASTSAKGVAQFDSGDFDVAAGVVSIKAAGVDNAQLAFSDITFTGTTGSDIVALGGSLSIEGGAGGEVSTDVAAGVVAISVRDATSSLKGIASFDSADFNVVNGAVSAVAKALDDLSDVAITTAAGGDTLIHNGTEFVNRKVYFLYTGGTASTSHTVTHNLGQKYCNVTVVDSTDEVIIPQSITFDGANGLTVTFTSAITCKVIVMGVNAA